MFYDYNVSGQNFKKEVKTFLFQYPSSPHSTKEETPAKLSMGRELLSKISSFEQRLASKTFFKTNKNDKESKDKTKEFSDKKNNMKTSDIKTGVKSFNKATKIKQTTRMISNQIVL